jgi:type IV secretion system protein VirB5
MLTAGHAHAQWAVFDAANAANTAQAIVQAKAQLDQLKNQLSQAKQAYDSISGMRDIGNVLKSDLLKQNLPADYQPVLQAIRSGMDGNLGGISSQILNTITANQLASCAKQYVVDSEKAACEQRWRQMAALKVTNDQSYASAANNIKNLEQLVNGITSSTDAKTIADLNARIQLEQIKITNEKVKLDTIAAMQAAQEKMDRENKVQQDRSDLRDISKKSIAF